MKKGWGRAGGCKKEQMDHGRKGLVVKAACTHLDYEKGSGNREAHNRKGEENRIGNVRCNSSKTGSLEKQN